MLKYKSKEKKENTGTDLRDEELTEYEQLLKELIERYEESERRTEESANYKKVKVQEDKKKAMDMREKARKGIM